MPHTCRHRGRGIPPQVRLFVDGNDEANDGRKTIGARLHAINLPFTASPRLLPVPDDCASPSQLTLPAVPFGGHLKVVQSFVNFVVNFMIIVVFQGTDSKGPSSAVGDRPLIARRYVAEFRCVGVRIKSKPVKVVLALPGVKNRGVLGGIKEVYPVWVAVAVAVAFIGLTVLVRPTCTSSRIPI